MHKTTYWIYKLIDPTNEDVKYVGMSKTPFQRYGQHLQLDAGSSAKRAWIQSLFDRYLMPRLELIEEVPTKAEAIQREFYWIKYYLTQGARLTNRDEESLTPLAHKWTKRKSINRLAKNHRVQEAMRLSQGLAHVIEDAVTQEYVEGYDSVECFLALMDRAEAYVGWDASNPDLQSSEYYDAVKDAIYDLLPPDA